jgi:pyruvate formate lyase activating enzyme
VSLLLKGGVDYEFRTTVVSEYHTREDIAAIAAWISGAPRYFLQPFVDSGNLIGSSDGKLHAPDATTLNKMLVSARTIIPATVLRGA